jgi:hypothetical protein
VHVILFEKGPQLETKKKKKKKKKRKKAQKIPRCGFPASVNPAAYPDPYPMEKLLHPCMRP